MSGPNPTSSSGGMPPMGGNTSGGEVMKAPGGAMNGGRKKTAWMSHVKATMRAHKGLKLKQILKLAKKTYKKTMRGGGVAGGLSPEYIALGGRRRRGSTRRSRARRGGDE